MRAATRIGIFGAAALLATFIAGGCRGGGAAGVSGGAGVSSLDPGRLKLASCGDWNASTVEERLGAIRGLGAYFGRAAPAGAPAQTLPENSAYDLFERICPRREAADVFLWGIYMQAANLSGYGEAYEAGLRELEEARR